jgi:hypothetical protein
VKKKKPKNWHDHSEMWVIGCIDSHGAIIGRGAGANGNIMHGKAESIGRRWRWNIHSQDWFACFGNINLTKEEIELVGYWLVEHEYADIENI